MLFIRLICTSGFINLNTGMPSTEYKIYLLLLHQNFFYCSYLSIYALKLQMLFVQVHYKLQGDV